MYTPNIKIMQHLANSEVARNDYKVWYLEFITKWLNEYEKAVVEKVLTNSISEATYQREVAFIQNTLELFEADEEVKAKRQKHRRKKQDFFWRFKELFIK